MSEKRAQSIADHAINLVANDDGLRVFHGHCLGCFDFCVVAVTDRHVETLLTLRIASPVTSHRPRPRRTSPSTRGTVPGPFRRAARWPR